jgi:hypothetical protein
MKKEQRIDAVRPGSRAEELNQLVDRVNTVYAERQSRLEQEKAELTLKTEEIESTVYALHERIATLNVPIKKNSMFGYDIVMLEAPGQTFVPAFGEYMTRFKDQRLAIGVEEHDDDFTLWFHVVTYNYAGQLQFNRRAGVYLGDGCDIRFKTNIQVTEDKFPGRAEQLVQSMKEALSNLEDASASERTYTAAALADFAEGQFESTLKAILERGGEVV